MRTGRSAVPLRCPLWLGWRLVAYLPWLFFEIAKANVDVALRILTPGPPIAPNIIRVHATQTTDTTRTIYANSITLTPGPLSIDVVGQDLYVHWINITTDDPDEQTRQIVGKFEHMLKRIFE